MAVAGRVPLCRTIGKGLWEIRTDLSTQRTARVLLCLYREHVVALHGFMKKTPATPQADLTTARKRQGVGARSWGSFRMSQEHLGSSIDDFLKEESAL